MAQAFQVGLILYTWNRKIFTKSFKPVLIRCNSWNILTKLKLKKEIIIHILNCDSIASFKNSCFVDKKGSGGRRHCSSLVCVIMCVLATLGLHLLRFLRSFEWNIAMWNFLNFFFNMKLAQWHNVCKTKQKTA